MDDARRWEALAERIGVTRVARVTGLDRSGVEVACAVRPGGHVLQISNGKGERWPEARRGALLEAAELWASERVDPPELVYGSAGDLRRHGHRLVDASDLGSAGALIAPRLWSDTTWMAWRRGVDLASGGAVLVPACAAHCLPGGSPPIGPAVSAWTTNGMGAHPVRSRALLHALLEAVERDQVARTLPQGWTRAAVAARMIEPRSLGPRAGRLTSRVRRGGFEVFLFDLSPPRRGGGVGLAVGGAILVDSRGGPIPVTAGYACAPGADDALTGALLEAAQSRLTDIHGAREDVSHTGSARLAGWCRNARPARRAAAMPSVPRTVAAVVRRLGAVGRRRMVAVGLAPPGSGIHVIKVVIPGLLVSELY